MSSLSSIFLNSWKPYARAVYFPALCFFLLCGFVLPAFGQTQMEPRRSESRDVEPMVSLSAATLTDILRHEPGLLLQVKKMLVRKAYEQGRLLDTEDLTDESLFRLLREDESIRILATEEVEKREYVRAKPTRRELDHERIERYETEKTVSTTTEQPPQSQEEKYWAQHEQMPARQNASPSTRVPVEPGSNQDRTLPTSQPPEYPARPALPDNRQQQNMAGVDTQDQNSYRDQNGYREQNPYDLPPDSGALPRISPENLPGLLSASMGDSHLTSAQQYDSDDASAFSNPLSSSSPLNSSSLRSPLPLEGGLPAAATLPPSTSDRGTERNFDRNPQRARLDNRYRQPIPSIPQDDHPRIRHRPNPYADVPSLYDLYAQVSKRSPVLTRFGENVFENGTGNFDELPMDMPVGPDYVLGPGDSLSIDRKSVV